MDDHFDRMLAPDVGSSRGGLSATQRPFIKAAVFEGRKVGYVFKMGPSGVGYYHDPLQEPPSDEIEAESKKRKLGEISSTRLDKSDIDRLLEEADKEDIEMLTAVTLKQLLLSFEKKINKNQTQRMKYADQPEKFMESELELHKEINELYAVSASPELYPILVEAGSVNSILGMVAHENTDISIAAVGLLLELMDPETILESEDAICVVDAFLEGQGLELTVQNLSRLDENVEEDAQGVHDSMAIIENLVEIRPSVAVTVCEKTHLLKFLLMRLREPKFDVNKLYCSEILSIMLQSDPVNLKNVADVQGAGEDGIEMLLQIVYQYRKKDPEGVDEKECVQNMFQSICTVLMDKDNQSRFRSKEGMELMLKYLKENKFSAAGAIRVISFATANNRENCERLLEVNGMRFLFPLFMGRGMPHGIKKAERKEIEESVISTLCQLCLQLHDSTTHQASKRLLAKFCENDLEKADHCVELFAKYSRILGQTERELHDMQQVLTLRAESADPEEAVEAQLELELLNNDDSRYLKRLDGGLHVLQQVAVMIAFICVYNNRDKASLAHLRNRLMADGLGLRNVQSVLREMAASIGDGQMGAATADIERNGKASSSASAADGAGTDGVSVDGGMSAATVVQRHTLITWSACIAAIENGVVSS